MARRLRFGGGHLQRSGGAVLASALLLAACTGMLGGPDPSSEGGAVGPGTPGSGDGAQGPAAGLRRLNASEYRATVQDLLGVDVMAGGTFQADTPVDGFTSIGTTTVPYAAQQIERFEQAAYDTAQKIFEDEARRVELVGCEPASGEDPCVREFLARFVRRAFRRPATTAEVDAYAGLVAAGAADSDPWSGLAYAVAAVLQSPNFLYRVELGEVDEEAGDARGLSAFEVATRLSYLVTGSTPDDELLDAAESGLLDTEAGLKAQLERLLESPKAESALMTFLEEQLELGHVDKVVKVADVFPDFSPALAEAMRHEMYEVVYDVAFRRPDDLLSLLTRRDTYVNGPLAALYDLPAPASADDWVPVTLPEDGQRAGLLGFAGFLASHAGPSETSVTKRGFFVVSKLLCREIPAPPSEIETLLPAPPEDGHATMRERVEQHMDDPSCRGCHALMDPPGLALEYFDAMGVYREKDNGLDIDATGEIDGQPFDGPRELGELLAGHPEVSACFARRFYEFALGRQVHAGAPVSDLVDAFERSGRRLPELVRALVTHDVFRRVSAPR